MTGTRGTIARDTARTLWMVEVGDGDGATFAVEAPASGPAAATP